MKKSYIRSTTFPLNIDTTVKIKYQADGNFIIDVKTQTQHFTDIPIVWQGKEGYSREQLYTTVIGKRDFSLTFHNDPVDGAYVRLNLPVLPQPHLEGLAAMQNVLQKAVTKSTLLINQENSKTLAEYLKKIDGYPAKTVLLVLSDLIDARNYLVNKWALEQLGSYQLDQRIIIYCPFSLIKNPQIQWMDKTLKLYGLYEHKDFLKEQPITWVIDGYDKYLLEGNPYFTLLDPFFLQGWKNIHFVIGFTNNLLKKVGKMTFIPIEIVRVPDKDREKYHYLTMSMDLSPVLPCLPEDGIDKKEDISLQSMRLQQQMPASQQSGNTYAFWSKDLNQEVLPQSFNVTPI